MLTKWSLNTLSGWSSETERCTKDLTARPRANSATSRLLRLPPTCGSYAVGLSLLCVQRRLQSHWDTRERKIWTTVCPRILPQTYTFCPDLSFPHFYLSPDYTEHSSSSASHLRSGALAITIKYWVPTQNWTLSFSVNTATAHCPKPARGQFRARTQICGSVKPLFFPLHNTFLPKAHIPHSKCGSPSSSLRVHIFLCQRWRTNFETSENNIKVNCPQKYISEPYFPHVPPDARWPCLLMLRQLCGLPEKCYGQGCIAMQNAPRHQEM